MQRIETSVARPPANELRQPKSPVVPRHRKPSSCLQSVSSPSIHASEDFDGAADADCHFALQPIIERLECGYIVINEYQRIIEANRAALDMLYPSDRTDVDHRREHDDIQHTDIMSAISEVGKNHIRSGALIWIATSSTRGVTVALNHIQGFTNDHTSIIVLLDLDKLLAPNPATLKLLFGLTFAEARIASYLAQGKTPNEIARILRVSRTTVRSQLAAVFSKTSTKRQSALVALLGRIAVLP